MTTGCRGTGPEPQRLALFLADCFWQIASHGAQRSLTGPFTEALSLYFSTSAERSGGLRLFMDDAYETAALQKLASFAATACNLVLAGADGLLAPPCGLDREQIPFAPGGNESEH